MTKSQFNIKISLELLRAIKKQAMMSGKSLTEHITQLIEKSLENKKIDDFGQSSIDKIEEFNLRLFNLESIVKNLEYLSPNLSAFTDPEAINCTEFMQGVFKRESEVKGYNNYEIAFEELVSYINIHKELDSHYKLRLRNILLEKKSIPWTAKELNDLMLDDKCNCPIRKGLISWTGKTNFPTQQEICDKGSILVSSL